MHLVSFGDDFRFDLRCFKWIETVWFSTGGWAIGLLNLRDAPSYIAAVVGIPGKISCHVFEYPTISNLIFLHFFIYLWICLHLTVTQDYPSSFFWDPKLTWNTFDFPLAFWTGRWQGLQGIHLSHERLVDSLIDWLMRWEWDGMDRHISWN